MLAGLLLGWCALLSYGLPLVGLVAVAVGVVARRVRPLAVAAVVTTVPLVVCAAYGFRWWQALPVLQERYRSGIAGSRPTLYRVWADLAVLTLGAGPALAVGLAQAAPRLLRAVRHPSTEPLAALVLAGVVMVVAADLSAMSKAEVERIWLPFEPWLLLSTAYLTPRWRGAALTAQVTLALAEQHLLRSPW